MWKEYLVNFTDKFEHPAWGNAHFKRVYELSKELARDFENIDLDSIFAASYLHDMGTFAPYKINGMEHADRSVEVAKDILISTDFPVEKISSVQDIIKGHMFYATPSNRVESIIFHDADTLEFMGFIGIARILSIIGLDDWAPDMKSAIKLIEQFSTDLPNKLHTPKAIEIGELRQLEMFSFLNSLSSQTNNFNLI